MELAANQTCTSSAIPTLFAWKDAGVWVLDLSEGEAWERCNELPTITDVSHQDMPLITTAPGNEYGPNFKQLTLDRMTSTWKALSPSERHGTRMSETIRVRLLHSPPTRPT